MDFIHSITTLPQLTPYLSTSNLDLPPGWIAAGMTPNIVTSTKCDQDVGGPIQNANTFHSVTSSTFHGQESEAVVSSDMKFVPGSVLPPRESESSNVTLRSNLPIKLDFSEQEEKPNLLLPQYASLAAHQAAGSEVVINRSSATEIKDGIPSLTSPTKEGANPMPPAMTDSFKSNLSSDNAEVSPEKETGKHVSDVKFEIISASNNTSCEQDMQVDEEASRIKESEGLVTSSIERLHSDSTMEEDDVSGELVIDLDRTDSDTKFEAVPSSQVTPVQLGKYGDISKPRRALFDEGISHTREILTSGAKGNSADLIPEMTVSTSGVSEGKKSNETTSECSEVEYSRSTKEQSGQEEMDLDCSDKASDKELLKPEEAQKSEVEKTINIPDSDPTKDLDVLKQDREKTDTSRTEKEILSSNEEGLETSEAGGTQDNTNYARLDNVSSQEEDKKDSPVKCDVTPLSDPTVDSVSSKLCDNLHQSSDKIDSTETQTNEVNTTPSLLILEKMSEEVSKELNTEKLTQKNESKELCGSNNEIGDLEHQPGNIETENHNIQEENVRMEKASDEDNINNEDSVHSVDSEVLTSESSTEVPGDGTNMGDILRTEITFESTVGDESNNMSIGILADDATSAVKTSKAMNLSPILPSSDDVQVDSVSSSLPNLASEAEVSRNKHSDAGIQISAVSGELSSSGVTSDNTDSAGGAVSQKHSSPTVCTSDNDLLSTPTATCLSSPVSSRTAVTSGMKSPSSGVSRIEQIVSQIKMAGLSGTSAAIEPTSGDAQSDSAPQKSNISTETTDQNQTDKAENVESG